MREIALEKTTEYIQVVMSGAPATTQPDCTVVYEEKSGKVESTALREEKSKTYQLAGATPVTIVPAPTNAKITIVVKNILIENRDTANVRFYVKIVDAGGTRVLYDVTLRPNYTWDLDGVKNDSGTILITHELDEDVTTADIPDSTNRRYITDAQRTVVSNTSGTNTGDQVVPVSTSATSNQFFTEYNAVTGAFTKARPTWANVDKATSSIADITTKSHTALTDIGTNTHAQIDTALTRLISTSGTNTGDQVTPVSTSSTSNQFFSSYDAVAGTFGKAQPSHTGITDIGTNTHAQIDTALTRLVSTSGTNTGDQVTPISTSSTSNQFFSSYDAVAGTFGKTRPIWADVDKGTSDIADITTKSHTSLTDIGTNTHAQIDTALNGLVSTSGVNTGDQDLTTLIAKSIGTAKGCIIGFSASGVPGILDPGSEGQFLIVSGSTALGIGWATHS